MRIGIFPNLVKRESAAIVKELIRICEARGLEYYLPAYVSESCQPAYQEIAADHFRPRMTITTPSISPWFSAATGRFLRWPINLLGRRSHLRHQPRFLGVPL